VAIANAWQLEATPSHASSLPL